jgi:hypothetical protein
MLLSLPRALLLAASCIVKQHKHVVQLEHSRLDAKLKISMVFSVHMVPEVASKVHVHVTAISMTGLVGSSRPLLHTCAHGAWRRYSESMCWDVGPVRC